jgi:hypothetical protein
MILHTDILNLTKTYLTYVEILHCFNIVKVKFRCDLIVKDLISLC